MLKLCDSITGKYFHNYCDNYFSSVHLFKKLLEKGLYSCGTVHTNHLFKKLLEKGLYSCGTVHTNHLFKKLLGKGLYSCGTVHTNHLFKKLLEKGLYSCGTVHTNRKCWPKDLNKKAFSKKQKVDAAVSHKQKDGMTMDIQCPALPQYNLYMNGVDTADQNRTQYSSCRKSVKWWKYLFWFVFDTCVANSLILLNSSANHQMQTSSSKVKKHINLEFHKALGDDRQFPEQT